ncbi:MAG: preprotein translocase subunit SecA, partial [Planctomycetota bacterium]|nr:preprotein translocase subunit SecA [Planctomycetota bacterium]
VPVSRGVHIVTVNDYLAQRDADYNRPLFSFLGLTVGAIQSHMDSQTRIPIYACDITYGTNNEFGFDYLRDNLKVTREDQVQRSRFFAIVDEVDSVLIDEARTPLIISGSTRESTDKYYLADRVARQLKGGDMNTVEDRIEEFMKQGLQREEARLRAEEDFDYVYSERDHSAKLTERGMHKVLRLLGMMDIYSGENLDMPHFIDNALRAHALYKRDHHYVVENDQVIIVDEFTGRKMEGRRWSDGLHQAVEAKEHLKIKEESQTVATITFQNFFRLYKKLAGMTGTAMTEAKEFDYIYKLGVVSIPTNRPLRRINYPDLVYGTLKEKYEALVEHVVETHKTGRPMLIGTVSIERSELISGMLKRRGVPHEVLNAKHHAREAQIVALAGRLGQVTVATNMAGRGTDIVLQEFTLAELLAHWQKWGLAPKAGISADMPREQLQEILRRHWVEVYLPEVEDKYEAKPAAEWDRLLKQRWEEMGIVGPVLTTRVAEMGGLHIVGSERHEARRIDNQLRGRAGRQGDPGSSRFFLSLEDDMMRQFAPDKVKRFMQWAGLKDGVPIESPLVSRSIENAQRKVEERNFEIRKNLLEYDQVMNEQRLIVYERRQRWLEGQGLRESAIELCENYIAKKVKEFTATHISEWDLAGLCRLMRDTFGIEIAPRDLEERKRLPEPVAAIEDALCERFAAAYANREAELGADNMRLIERLVLLTILDRRWMDHLYEMDLLKESIHLEGYAGRDPKIRYKIEGYNYFQEMWSGLEAEVAETILKVRVHQTDNEEGRPAAAAPRPRERVEIKAAIHAEYQAAAAEAESKSAGGAEGRPQPIRHAGPRVKPNDPCPCKSGKKYKKCCGR